LLVEVCEYEYDAQNSAIVIRTPDVPICMLNRTVAKASKCRAAPSIGREKR